MMKNLATVLLLFVTLYEQSLGFSADECRLCVGSGHVFCRIVDTNFSSTKVLTDYKSGCCTSSECKEDNDNGTNTASLSKEEDCVDDAFSDEYIDELDHESFFALAGGIVIVLLVIAMVGTVVVIAGCVYCCCCVSSRQNIDLPAAPIDEVAQPLLETSSETNPDQPIKANPM